MPERKVPKTLENTREQDETIVHEGDQDVEAEHDEDEFADHFQNVRPPHVLLTTSYKATGIMYKFCKDLMVRVWQPETCCVTNVQRALCCMQQALVCSRSSQALYFISGKAMH